MYLVVVKRIMHGCVSFESNGHCAENRPCDGRLLKGVKEVRIEDDVQVSGKGGKVDPDGL